jgi:Ca2+-binding RTX toxin-like protein
LITSGGCGLAGDDKLTADAGDDYVDVVSGNDTLKGSSGNDLRWLEN